MPLTPESIKRLIESKHYRFSQHAEVEREADQITIAEFEEAFLRKDVEILETRPNDPRGYNCLALGWTKNNKPIHAVLGQKSDILVVVTVYRPDPELWIDFRERR